MSNYSGIRRRTRRKYRWMDVVDKKPPKDHKKIRKENESGFFILGYIMGMATMWGVIILKIWVL